MRESGKRKIKRDYSGESGGWRRELTDEETQHGTLEIDLRPELCYVSINIIPTVKMGIRSFNSRSILPGPESLI